MSCVAGRNVRTVPTSLACDGITLIAPGIARVHRADADHGGVDRAHVAAHDRLRGGDDVSRDQHRIDRGVRMRAVAALAVDGDLDAVGGRHRRPRRDADASRRQARPVVERVDLLGGKALEEAVGDHLLRAGVAFLARLEDEIRGAVERCASRAGNAPRRAASSCGRRGRSRACARRSATCARTRSLPASAARPCRRAGRPSARWRCCGPGRRRRRRCAPMPAWCSMPSAARCSQTTFAVRCSSKPSSGCMWRSRRTAVNSSCHAAMCRTGIHVIVAFRCATLRSMRSRGSTA